jgi:predicted transcriptional regulator
LHHFGLDFSDISKQTGISRKTISKYISGDIMFAVDFFLQLGPDFKDYAEVFVKNGFNDVETICTMHIQEDLDTMFSEETMPLGHSRKKNQQQTFQKSFSSTLSHN